ncbi:hypothetical protein BX070DRAFT_221779 [Coemansia spiralis]|nr:hypothetical protein BX070DRAFT_221779 [Coemansia spiralis]
MTAYTDGSFISDADRLSLLFAVALEFKVDNGELEQVCVNDRAANGPFSSMTVELMAIVATMAIAPRNCKAVILSDSRATISIAEELADKENIQYQHERSNLAYLATMTRLWFQQRRAETWFRWVKGRPGNSSNEQTDRLAGEANTLERPWTTRTGVLPPDMRFWVCGKRTFPQPTNGLLRKQYET